MDSHILVFTEIRAKNNGFESVEVIDNGSGIDVDSFDSLCEFTRLLLKTTSNKCWAKGHAMKNSLKSNSFSQLMFC